MKAQKEQETAQTREDDEDGIASTDTSASLDSDGDDPWTSLTTHISPRLLGRILPQDIYQCDGNGVNNQSWILSSISTSPLDTEHIPGLTQSETNNVLNEAQTLYLLPIDLKKTWGNADVGSTRTERARDRSWYLSHLITTLQAQGTGSGPLTQQLAAKDLLAELQFTFLMVLCLANYSCLEQWKRVLSVLFTCQSALSEVEGFFVEAVSILRVQLGRVEDVEGGLFEMGDEVGSAWLRRLLRGFREHVDEVAGTDKLGGVLKGLEEWLRERYGWADERNVVRRGMVQLEDGEMVEMQEDGVDEEEETGEYAPVVVDM